MSYASSSLVKHQGGIALWLDGIDTDVHRAVPVRRDASASVFFGVLLRWTATVSSVTEMTTVKSALLPLSGIDICRHLVILVLIPASGWARVSRGQLLSGCLEAASVFGLASVPVAQNILHAVPSRSGINIGLQLQSWCAQELFSNYSCSRGRGTERP